MTEEPTHRVEHDGAVATVTLDRPDALNAQTRASRRALVKDLRALSADDAVRCVVLTGAGRAFCAGQDLREEGALVTSTTMIRETYIPIVEALVGMPKPVIAAINGAAAGAGLSIALACDLRYMAEDAVLMMAFSNIALVPDCGGSWLLYAHRRLCAGVRARRDGPSRQADEALSLGLVQRVLPRRRAAGGHARGTRVELAARPTQALGWTKRLLRAAEQSPLADVMELEAQLQAGGRAHARSRRGRRRVPREARAALRGTLNAVAKPRLRLIVNPVASACSERIGADGRCARSSCVRRRARRDRAPRARDRARGGGRRARLRRRRLPWAATAPPTRCSTARATGFPSASCPPAGRACCRARLACRGTSERPRRSGRRARRRARAPHQPRRRQRPPLRVRRPEWAPTPRP